MATYRRARVNDAVREELSVALREIKDPRVAGALISILGVEVAPDLRQATVRYSVYGADSAEVARGLRSATGYLRRVLAQKLNLRITPELVFREDDSIAHGARIAKLLADNPAESESTDAANGTGNADSTDGTAGKDGE